MFKWLERLRYSKILFSNSTLKYITVMPRNFLSATKYYIDRIHISNSTVYC